MELIVLTIFIGLCYFFWPKKKTTQSLFDELPQMLDDFQQRVLAADRTGNHFRMQRTPLESRGTVLQKSENVVIDVPIVLARSVKTGAQWKSGSRGVRVSPIKGLSFSLGGSKGKMVSSSEFQQDIGWLTLTTKRILFKGKGITFAVPLSKVGNMSRDDALIFIDLTSRDVPDFHAAFPNSSIASLFSMLYSDPDCKFQSDLKTQ